jgi:CYTH domain-containing protein
MQPTHKYARTERERRFLLRTFPQGVHVVRSRRITDRYIEGTFLRLREQKYDDGLVSLKLTQKIPERGGGAKQGLITSMYLSESEFAVLARLPAKQFSKTRYSVPPFGIDVFQDELQGLVLAEAEFDSPSEADAVAIPDYVICEVSEDDRFTGGRLVCATRPELTRWLGEYGIDI